MAEWGLTLGIAFLIIAGSAIGAGVLANVLKANRECSTNNDCATTGYCGSDFNCHEYPTIQQTVVQANYTTPAIILAIGFVLGALVVRWKNTPAEEQ